MQQLRVIATPPYQRQVAKLLPPLDRAEMEQAVAANPEAHPIIPTRKMKRRIFPMPKKQPSAGLSKASKRARKRAGTTRFGRDIVEGLKAAVAFSRGEISLPVRIVNVPSPVDVGKIRARSGLSQAEFAARYGFSHRTLQEWEQRRVQPDGATRAYLTVIDRNPHAVQAALSGRSSKVLHAGG